MLTVYQLKALRPRDATYNLTYKPGLMLRVFPNGNKKWVVNKSVAGKRLVKQIGSFPDILPAEACKRMAALAAAAATCETTDLPTAAPRVTFGEVFEQWKRIKSVEIKRWADTENRARLYLLPRFGPRPFDGVTPPEIIEVLRDKLERRGKYETIKRVCNILAQLERFAVNSGYVSSLKFAHLHEVFIRPTVSHMAAPPLADLPDVLRRLQVAAYKAQNTWDAFLVAFYTLLRPGEYCALRWDWIDGDTITVPADVMKMKRAFRVPVCAPLRALLEHRPRVSRYVLASPDKPDRHLCRDNCSIFLKKHGFRGILVPHGIRSLGRTWLTQQQADFYTAELCLAHEPGNAVSRAYDRDDRLEARRPLMEKWGEFVRECLQSQG